VNLRRVGTLAAGNIRLGFRSPVILWVLILPFAITFLVHVVFAALFDPEPRLSIYDPGDSEITMAFENAEGVRFERAESREELINIVESNNADLGLLMEDGFDEAVKAGLKPEMDFYFSSGSLVFNRIIIALLVLDRLREMENNEAPVNVVLRTDDDGTSIPVSRRLIPAIVIVVLMIGGIFVPAFMLVEEREHGTIRALLITPASMADILISKALLGFMMTVIMCVVTLALNGALSGHLPALLASIIVGTLICNITGLVYGTLAADAKTLYTLVKSLNILLAAPVLFYLFTDLPGWVARLFPTYWFIDPLYRVTLEGATFSDVYRELALAVLVGIILAAAIIPLSRRMQRKLAE
jgi:ABC-2 type transport system permease protein